jgi:CheY-like chemotaxis protein
MCEDSDRILVLVVEDEPINLQNVQEALDDAGFRTAIASTGEQGITKLEELGAEIAGVITDVRIGSGVSGWDVARAAREQKPNMPIVYMTAADADEWSVQGVPKSLLVHKPFVLAQIVTAISSLITAASSSLPPE